MTLNDFKSIKGDRRLGIDSIPASLGAARAARCACLFMAVPQVIVVMQLHAWGQGAHAIAVLILLLIQVAMMIRFLAKPTERALWYSAFGVILFVSGMMVSAFAVRGIRRRNVGPAVSVLLIRIRRRQPCRAFSL